MKELGSLSRVLEAAGRCPLYIEKYKDFNNILDVNLRELPFLNKHELLKESKGALSIPMSEVAYIYCSSGSMHNPKIFYYTKRDIDRISKLSARFSRLEGVNQYDNVVILLPMRLWAAGPITQYGHSRVGATVIPLDLSGRLETKASIFNILEPSVLSSTPSILLDFIEYDLVFKDLKLIETTGEPLIKETREDIERKYNSEVFNAYGLSECIIGTECSAHDGFHYWPDTVNVEIVDLKNPTIQLPEGEVGEIVITNLLQEAMPIIRYRTGDMGYISTAICKCGRSLPRVWVKGRIKETIFLPSAVKIYQYQILKVLNKFPDLSTNYQVVISKKKQKTFIDFYIEAQKNVDEKEIEKALSEISLDFVDLYQNNIVELNIKVVNQLKRSPISNKVLNRIIDKRKIYQK